MLNYPQIYLNLYYYFVFTFFCQASKVKSNNVNNEDGVLSTGVQWSSARFYHTFVNNQKQDNDPDKRVISGFVDGEGCFNLIIYKDSSFNTGWRVKLIFKISLHKRDKELLESIKNYFKVGNITKHGPQSIQYRVSSIEDLEVIINFLEKYKLITQKCADYELFKQVHILVKNKEHLTQ